MLENNYLQDDEQEIDVGALIIYVLHRWRSLLAALLVTALLGFGVSLVKNAKEMKALNDPVALQKLQTNYEIDKAVYDNSVIYYENTLESLTKRLDYLNTCSEQSVFSKMDPSNVWSGTVNVFLSVENSNRNSLLSAGGISLSDLVHDQADTLACAYANNLSTCEYLQGFAEQFGTDLNFLRELVQVTPDYESNSVNITVLAPDKETAQAMLDEILTHMDGLYDEMRNAFGAHTVTPMNENVALDNHGTYFDITEEQQILLKQLAETQTALNSLNEPEMPAAMDRTTFVKDGVKFGVVGGLIGLMLLGFIYVIIYIMDQHVRSADDLKSRYGIRILGAFPRSDSKRTSRFDTWLDHLENRDAKKPEQVYQHIVASIHNCAADKRKLLLTGTSDTDQLEESCRALSALLPEMDLTSGDNMIKNADVLRSLTNFDGIILVETARASRYKDIDTELEYVRDSNVPLLGFILL